MKHDITTKAEFRKLVLALREEIDDPPVEIETIAVGILDRLSHIAISSTPRGDIGRVSDDLLADMMGWPPKRASVLVSILIETGWIDEDETHRLLLANWADNAPNFIKGNLRSRKLGFFTKNGPTEETTKVTKETKRKKVTKLKEHPAKQGAKQGAKRSLSLSSKEKQRKTDSFNPQINPPTVEEVREYAKQYASEQKANGVKWPVGQFAAQAFHNYYTARKWKQGGSLIEDWSAAARGWGLKDFGNSKPKPAPVNLLEKSQLEPAENGAGK